MLIYLDNERQRRPAGRRARATAFRRTRTTPASCCSSSRSASTSSTWTGRWCSTSTARPLPAYSETDVKEIARALTGWYAAYPSGMNPEDPTEFVPAAGLRAGRRTIAGTRRCSGEVIAADTAQPGRRRRTRRRHHHAPADDGAVHRQGAHPQAGHRNAEPGLRRARRRRCSPSAAATSAPPCAPS